MRYVAAYLLAVLGGNEAPTSKDLKKILDSVGIETDDERLNKVLALSSRPRPAAPSACCLTVCCVTLLVSVRARWAVGALPTWGCSLVSGTRVFPLLSVRSAFLSGPHR